MLRNFRMPLVLALVTGIAGGVAFVMSCGNMPMSTCQAQSCPEITTLTSQVDSLNAQISSLNTQVAALQKNATASVLRLVKTADQISGVGGAAVIFDSMKINALSGWNFDTFTAPSAGLYRMSCRLVLPAAPGTGARYINLFVNGAQYSQTNSLPAGEGTTIVAMTDIVQLAAGGTISIRAQSDTGSFTVAGVGSGIGTTITIERLGN